MNPIYKQARKKNKKNPDGYEYIINERSFKTIEGARAYGQKLISDAEKESKKVRQFDPESGTYKTFDNQEDFNKYNTTINVVDDGKIKKMTQKEYKAFVKDDDKKIAESEKKYNDKVKKMFKINNDGEYVIDAEIEKMTDKLEDTKEGTALSRRLKVKIKELQDFKAEVESKYPEPKKTDKQVSPTGKKIIPGF